MASLGLQAAAFVWVSLALASSAFAGSPSAQVEPAGGVDAPAHPDRLIVRFKTGVSAGQRAAVLSRAGMRSRRYLRLAGAHVVESVKRGRQLGLVLEQLGASEFVEAVEPDFEVSAMSVTPNEPDFEALWGLQAIRAPEAWQRVTGSDSLVVGVIDTGVDYTHPDLAANMWRNPGEQPNGIDDDGNGYVDDIHGIDCITGDGDPFDDGGHGTNVAGTIGAVGNNGIGVVGVAWNVRIMALKFLPASGKAYTSDAIECLDYATAMRSRGVDIRLTNNSWGGGGISLTLRAAIERAGAAGMLFVVAAGNGNRDLDTSPSYPAAFDLDNMISVAALDGSALLLGSNYGATRVDLAAPGANIRSTVAGDTYGYFEGTSMAAPHVSGGAVLAWAMHPEASAAKVKNLLLATAQPLPELQGRVVSSGYLDVAAAACLPGERSVRIEPGDGFQVEWGSQVPVRASLYDCMDPILGAAVTVTPSTGERIFLLRDDGLAPDAVAGDGRYSASWQPTRVGPIRLTIRSGSGTASVQGEIAGEVLPSPLDSDGDGRTDDADNCPRYPTANFADADGNGVGDECECGDQDQDALVGINDIVAMSDVLFRRAPASPLCDTNYDARCDVSDIPGMYGKIFGRPAYCSRYPPPGP